MTTSVLGSVALGYQLLWDRQHRLGAVRLWLDADPRLPIDATHALSVLQDAWSPHAPPLVLNVSSSLVLREFVGRAHAASPWIEIPGHAANDAALLQRMAQAHRQGARMVWGGDARHLAGSTLAPYFRDVELDLTALEARHETGRGPLSPDAEQIQRLMAAIDGDASLDQLESHIGQDPVLTHRFLMFVNSASLGLRHAVQTLHQGLIQLGNSALMHWAKDTLASSHPDPGHRPWRQAVVTRARVMTQLLEAWEEDTLSQEVYLCGLLCEIGQMLGESQTQALGHLPLPERITDALLGHGGPYALYLDMARLLEAPPGPRLHQLCASHDLSQDSVNRALLRGLRGLRSA